MDQVENFKENEQLLPTKLDDIEDDREIRNVVFDLLHMDKDIDDMQIQREVIERFGERYPAMTLNDWRHIIEAYTSMIRPNLKDPIPEEKARTIQMQFPMAAEEDV